MRPGYAPAAMSGATPSPRRARAVPRVLATIVPFLASSSLVSLFLASPARAQGDPDDTPSILLIVTDDQRWDTLWAMPEVRRLLVGRGVTFTEAFTTSSLCCPSRASILTGAYPHTTGVYRQGSLYGGFRSFEDDTTIATVLRDAGYRTGYFGKYLDAYQSAALAGYIPPGWDRWAAFVHAEYHDYGLTIDGTVERFGTRPEEYSTDVLGELAERFIRTTGGPVFAVFAPAAPHAPAIPAEVDARAFEGLPAWRPPSFNEPDVDDKPAYVRAFERLGPARIEQLDRLRRDQYRTLQAVDRAVARLIEAFADTGRLADALVIFTSDNGLLWGEHRWVRKEVPYEEAIRVPLVVRADAVVGDVRSDAHLVGNIDLAPTMADIAGVDLPGDGRSLRPLLSGDEGEWRDAILIEHLRGANPVPTYCAVRTDRYLFAAYGTGERELYDLSVDPYQLRNLAGTGPGGTQERLERALRGLCDPPPPGYEFEANVGAMLLGLGIVVMAAVVARRLVAGSRGRAG
jgi:N-acetylglucosamine-6-sulfatase